MRPHPPFCGRKLRRSITKTYTNPLCEYCRRFFPICQPWAVPRPTSDDVFWFLGLCARRPQQCPVRAEGAPGRGDSGYGVIPWAVPRSTSDDVFWFSALYARCLWQCPVRAEGAPGRGDSRLAKALRGKSVWMARREAGRGFGYTESAARRWQTGQAIRSAHGSFNIKTKEGGQTLPDRARQFLHYLTRSAAARTPAA